MLRHHFLFIAALVTLFVASDAPFRKAVGYAADGQPTNALAQVNAKAKSNYLRQPRKKETKKQPVATKAEVGGEGHRIMVGKGDSQIPVVVVRGTPYEMGWHLGRLTRAEMHRFIPAAMAGMQQDLGVTEPSHAGRLVADGRVQRRPFRAGVAWLGGRLRVALATLQAVHVLPMLSPYSCSSIAAWGKATEDGHLYQTRNLDWSMKVRAHDFPVVIVYLPTQGIPHVVPSFAGMIGAHTGMNVRGIALSEMGDSPAKEAPYNLLAPHFMVFFRTMLYDADSLSRAIEIFKAVPHTKRYHFVFGDGRRSIAPSRSGPTAPSRPSRRIVIWKDNDSTDEFAPNVLENVVYNDEGRGAFPLLKQEYGKLNAEKMIDIANHIPIRGSNVVDVVYDATALRLWVSYAKGSQEAYQRPYTLIDLKTLADQDGKPLCAQAFGEAK